MIAVCSSGTGDTRVVQARRHGIVTGYSDHVTFRSNMERGRKWIRDCTQGLRSPAARSHGISEHLLHLHRQSFRDGPQREGGAAVGPAATGIIPLGQHGRWLHHRQRARHNRVQGAGQDRDPRRNAGGGEELIQQINVRLEPAGDGLKVVIDRPPVITNAHFGVSLDADVPTKTNLTLETSDGGVNITNMTGTSMRRHRTAASRPRTQRRRQAQDIRRRHQLHLDAKRSICIPATAPSDSRSNRRIL